MSREELEKRVRAVEGLKEIKKLHQNYVGLMDNLQYEEVLDLFTRDGRSEIRNFGAKKGKKEMAEVYLDVVGRHQTS